MSNKKDIERKRTVKNKKGAIYIDDDFREILEKNMIIAGFRNRGYEPDYKKLCQQLEYKNKQYFREIIRGQAPISVDMLMRILVLFKMDYVITYKYACKELGEVEVLRDYE